MVEGFVPEGSQCGNTYLSTGFVPKESLRDRLMGVPNPPAPQGLFWRTCSVQTVSNAKSSECALVKRYISSNEKKVD